jgi:hypothetical protein
MIGSSTIPRLHPPIRNPALDGMSKVAPNQVC